MQIFNFYITKHCLSSLNGHKYYHVIVIMYIHILFISKPYWPQNICVKYFATGFDFTHQTKHLGHYGIWEKAEIPLLSLVVSE